MNPSAPLSSPSASASLQRLWRPIVAMILVIVVSNIAVQYPLNDWLTWGAFTYPLVFLVSDLTNRAVGAASARKVAWAGFAVAVVLSWWVADPRIAVASGTAFIVSQLLDITVFNRWRAQSWWKAPFFGSMIGSVIDTALFFSIAFAGTEVPGPAWRWATWPPNGAWPCCCSRPTGPCWITSAGGRRRPRPGPKRALRAPGEHCPTLP